MSADNFSLKSQYQRFADRWPSASSILRPQYRGSETTGLTNPAPSTSSLCDHVSSTSLPDTAIPSNRSTSAQSDRGGLTASPESQTPSQPTQSLLVGNPGIQISAHHYPGGAKYEPSTPGSLDSLNSLGRWIFKGEPTAGIALMPYGEDGAYSVPKSTIFLESSGDTGRILHVQDTRNGEYGMAFNSAYCVWGGDHSRKVITDNVPRAATDAITFGDTGPEFVIRRSVETIRSLASSVL